MSTPTPPDGGRSRHPRTDPNAIYRPEGAPGTGAIPRNPANEETTLLTPVPQHTDALNRIPVSERRRWRIIAGAAGGLAAIMTGFTAYLWVVSDRWEERSAALEQQSYDLGDRLRQEQDYVVQQQEQLDILGDQLDTAQRRITDLADENAQADDAFAYYQQQLSLSDELAALGGSVSLALNRCVNEQKTLVGYWKNIDSYDMSEVLAFESTVNAICAAAQSANSEYQKQLAE